MLFSKIKKEHICIFTNKMPPKIIKNDEDDKPRTFELIEVIPKGEDKDDYDPVGILYRDPRVDENGGFVAERGYIVDFNSTREEDKITLMTNWPTEAKITRKGPKNYVGDAEHDVYCYPLDISCKKKPSSVGDAEHDVNCYPLDIYCKKTPQNGRNRNNHGRRRRGGGGGGGSSNSNHT